jgi:hypothetical protein
MREALRSILISLFAVGAVSSTYVAYRQLVPIKIDFCGILDQTTDPEHLAPSILQARLHAGRHTKTTLSR